MAVMGSSSRLGGAERGTVETAASDATRGGRWLIVLRDTGPGEVTRLCSELGVDYALVKSTRHVRRLIRKHRPDIVYVFGPRWSVPLRLALAPSRLRNSRTPRRRPRFIVAQRGLDVWRRPWHNWADRYTHLLVDRYVANSHAAASTLVEQVGIPAEKVSVLHTGLGADWFAAPSERRNRPGLPLRVIVVGNDRPEKALDEAVAALAAVADFPWEATIYTDVAERLASIVAAAGIEGRVRIVSKHRVTPVDYDAADLLLQTSVAESLPRAVLEAVARGVRVIATDVGDTAAIVPMSQLFPAGDRAAAAAMLRRFLQDQGVPQGLHSYWNTPQPVKVASELVVVDAFRSIAHDRTRT
uniref:Unannotated protein n=1 Tax=freshwater metagenome TaxID=449393 RepID=A0A6J7LVZ4_9ZZZZ